MTKAPKTAWPKARKAYAEEQPYCEFRLTTGVLCSKIGVDVHHIIFRSQGGGNEPENLMTVCRKHHGEKHGIFGTD